MPKVSPQDGPPITPFDPRYIGSGLAALGMFALATAGYVSITTPETRQCEIALADAKARLELLTEAKDACKEALTLCLPPGQPRSYP